VGAAVEVARRAGEVAGPQAGAAVKAAVDTAFIAGFRAGSWVSAGVVLVGALIALRWLPSAADDDVAVVVESPVHSGATR
jgi:hypothetical protein